MPAPVMWLYPSLTWRGNPAGDSVYLTFDDGPTPELTPWILETLSEYRVKATFFCVGENLRDFPDLAKAIIEGGHRIGNHTHNHLVGWNSSANEYVDNVEVCEQWVRRYDTGKLFRPPHGRISRAQIRMLQRRGYEIVMWDLLAGDFDGNLNPPAAVRKIIHHTSPGTVIIFHDNVKAAENLKAMLPEYLEELKSMGLNTAKWPS